MKNFTIFLFLSAVTGLTFYALIAKSTEALAASLTLVLAQSIFVITHKKPLQ